MGHEEFVELVRRMREEQQTGGAYVDPEDGMRRVGEDLARLEKQVDDAIGMMDGKAWCEGWRPAAKEGT